MYGKEASFNMESGVIPDQPEVGDQLLKARCNGRVKEVNPDGSVDALLYPEPEVCVLCRVSNCPVRIQG
jgi:hypothetical protein